MCDDKDKPKTSKEKSKNNEEGNQETEETVKGKKYKLKSEQESVTNNF